MAGVDISAEPFAAGCVQFHSDAGPTWGGWQVLGRQGGGMSYEFGSDPADDVEHDLQVAVGIARLCTYWGCRSDMRMNRLSRFADRKRPLVECRETGEPPSIGSLWTEVGERLCGSFKAVFRRRCWASGSRCRTPIPHECKRVPLEQSGRAPVQQVRQPATRRHRCDNGRVLPRPRRARLS